MDGLCPCPQCNGEGPPEEMDDLDRFIAEQCEADPKFAAAYAARQDEVRRSLAETFAMVDLYRRRFTLRHGIYAGYYDLPDTISDDDPPARSARFVAAPPEDAASDW